MKFHYLFLLLLIGCQQEENLEVEWSFPEDLGHEYMRKKHRIPLENCLVTINPVITGEYRMNYFDDTFLILKIYEHDEHDFFLKYKFEITHYTCDINYYSNGWAFTTDNGILFLRVEPSSACESSTTTEIKVFGAKNKSKPTPFVFETGLLRFKYKNTDLIGFENNLAFKAWNISKDKSLSLR